MNDIAVSKDGVIKLLKGLNPSKALGPDELHPRVLKELATELGPVFAHLFQQSIDTGEIPKEWSLANICPLFKKSDRSLACNYRPVSLTCVPCKLLENIVCSNIMAHLDEHKLLSDRQHAFRKGLLHIEVRLPVLLCAVKTVEGDFRFCWTTTPNIGQTHKENPNLVRILYMVCTLNDIYKQYNKLHEH